MVNTAMRIDAYKDKIKTALLNKQEKISVEYYNASNLFQSVLRENPTIAAKIKNVQYDELLVGGVFSVTYTVDPDNDSEVLHADTGEQVEDAMHKAIRHYKPEVSVSVAKSVNVSEVYNNFLVAYQGYYSNLISIECEQQFNIFGWKNLVKFSFNYRIGRIKLSMMEREVNKKLAEINNILFCYGMPNEVKAFVAHNYLAKTVVYWLDEDAGPLEKSYMQSAYGALINKKCVCQGYAEAYKRILDSQGITCEVICGKIKGSPDYHAWNVVSFDDKEFYHVDVTWDAQGKGKNRYKYYGLTDEQMREDRIWTRLSHMVCAGSDNILEKAQLQLAQLGGLFASRGVNKKYFN